MGGYRYIYRDRDGIRRTMHVDPDRPSEVTVQTQQDLEPIINGIKRDREIMRNNGDMVVARRIPGAIYEELQRQGITEDHGDFRKWLNSSEARPWRIYPGDI